MWFNTFYFFLKGKNIIIGSGKNDPSQSLQMIQRPMMTPDELKSMPKGHFIVSKTGSCPMKTRLKLFPEWGIRFEKIYEIEEKSARKVAYADRGELEQEIIRRHVACVETDEEPETAAPPAQGGMPHAPVKEEAEAMPKTKALLKSKQSEAPVRVE